MCKECELSGKQLPVVAVPESATQQAVQEPSCSSVESRYRDAYLVSSAVAAIGAAVKIIGVVLGLLILLAGVISGMQSSSVAVTFGGVLLGAVVAIPIFVLGVLVSAQAQVLKATLDTAVHSSPFLTKENMARVMSL